MEQLRALAFAEEAITIDPAVLALVLGNTPVRKLLAPFRPPTLLDDAYAYLDGLLEDCELLSLYIHFFPEQWVASTANQQRRYMDTPSDAEMEFFGLVSDNLFPLYEEFVLSPPPGDPGKWKVPVMAEGFDLDEPVYTHGDGWQVLLVVIGSCPVGATTLKDHRLVTLLEQVRCGGDNQLFDFFDDLEQRGEWYGYVEWMTRIVSHKTGNMWLDDGSDISYITLARSDIEQAAAAYTESEALWATANDAAKMLEDPAKLAEVIEIWNRHQV